jgi:hypothetical protein
MVIAIAFVLGLLIAFKLYNRRAKAKHSADNELAALSPWIHQELTRVLAKKLNLESSLSKLRASFKGDPDVECVSQIERATARVELEFVKYAHETACEVLLHIVFEDGSREQSSTHRALPELPSSVRTEFEQRAVTRVYRNWDFPWAESRAL